MQVLGFVYLAIYIILMGIATFLQKSSLKSINPIQLNFLINISNIVVASIAILWKQHSVSVPEKAMPLGFTIGGLMAIASLSFLLSLTKMHVGVASTIAISYVIIVVLLSWWFLKEPLGVLKILGIVLTLVGVAILSWK